MKPYSLNISNPIYIEEFCEACDVIITDPYVYKSGQGKKNQNRIKVTGEEMNRVAGTDKKTVLIFWWWFPERDDHGTADADTYADSWDEGVSVGVSGLGGFNFSESAAEEDPNALSSYQSSGPVHDLWEKIKEKI